MDPATGASASGGKWGRAARVITPVGVATLVGLGFSARGTLDQIETGISQTKVGVYRDCDLTAQLNDKLRAAIATTIIQQRERRRVLALFPKLGCQR